MLFENANKTISHLMDALIALECARLECILGDDGTGKVYATEAELKKIKQWTTEIIEYIEKERRLPT